MNTDLLDLVLTELSAEIDSESLVRRWAAVGHVVPAGPSLRAPVSTLVDAHREAPGPSGPSARQP